MRGRGHLPGLLLAALFAAAVTSAPAVAQTLPVPGSIEAGIGGGRFFGGSFQSGSNDLVDHRVQADQDILTGFWLGAQLSRCWGLELAVRRTETQLVEPAGRVFARKPAVAVFVPATVELLGLRSYPLGNFVPYAGFGAGFMNLDVDVNDAAVRDVNRFCLSMTVGARYYAARWIGARIDVRGRATYLGARSLGEDHGFFDTGRWFPDAELLAGVFLSFGGKASP